jgi:prepilin-type N-terminal cleavage/methylation domain-containing protein/prepilin-type processing-associated H-X9-DG protein
MMHNVIRRRAGRLIGSAFTLVELLVVIAIVSLLATLVIPSVGRALDYARKVECISNLRSINTAFSMYLAENRGRFFPYREKVSGGTLWYWGYEPSGHNSPEGERPIEKNRARLAPYFASADDRAACANMPSGDDYKSKFDKPGYGYGINYYMLEGNNDNIPFRSIAKPSDTITWSEAAQINTWQAPASAGNPMLEEWYYLDNKSNSPATFHFRHDGTCNAAFADGRVGELEPEELDSRCDGLVGRPEETPSRPRPGEKASVSYLLDLGYK